jgi:hypothetical protein
VLIYKSIYPLWSDVYAILPCHSKTSCYEDGTKALFWDAAWAEGLNPKVITPSIYAISKEKSWGVPKAVTNDTWVLQFKI